MTPLAYYYQQCAAGNIIEDAQQVAVLQLLNHIQTELLQRMQKTFLSWFKKQKPIKGLYLWGSVGIGKTFLMDCFYHTLPLENKMRLHFHAFMQMIHHELKQLQGEKNPLQIIAKRLAKKACVLCFDEFVVTDIADAMILARLLEALLHEHVTLIITSNTMPDELYLKGLQRPLFLPAIALIKAETTVFHAVTANDYRLRQLKQAGVFFTPLNTEAEQSMLQLFDLLSNHDEIREDAMIVNDRSIPVIKKSSHCIWFEFETLCHVPRSQTDYLVIAKQFSTVFLSHIPILTHASRDQIILFIKLIDVLYDARIRFIFSAETTVDAIYTEGNLSTAFARTRSRLIEMQSELYFSSLTL